MESYINDKFAREIVMNISNELLNCDITKFKRCNFFSLFADGCSTDSSITEKEVIYISFIDPDTFELKSCFFP